MLLDVGRLVRLFLARLGKDRSMTVSLEEMLEEEDMLSRWLPGSNLLQRRSFMVASVQTSGTADCAWPAETTATRTCPSLFVLLTGACDGRLLKRALLAWAVCAGGGTGVPVDIALDAAARGSVLWSDFNSAVSFFFSGRVSCFSLWFDVCSMNE